MKQSKRILCIAAVLAAFSLMALGSGSTDGETVEKVGEVSETSQMESVTETAQDSEPQDAYCVGDELTVEGMRYIFEASGEYVTGNEFLQPADGNKYIYLKFYCENVSNSDNSVSSLNFEAYADGYAVSQYYGGDNDLSATLSPGRSCEGCVYFEVPENAAEIEIEYEPNFITGDKICFVYEGEKTSDFVPETSSATSENAFEKGDIVESEDLRITYLDCGTYYSDNMFIEPADGNRFIYCEFEFENISDTDQYVSSLEFYCYADGQACDSTYVMENDLSATLSPGRKTTGTVCFEIPENAVTVEVEYLTNFWNSDRIVFAYSD